MSRFLRVVSSYFGVVYRFDLALLVQLEPLSYQQLCFTLPYDWSGQKCYYKFPVFK
jgi:hypothetical protein